ncbi:ABC transporter substrate-binding protein [Salipaludibacillus sp. HK11]|uniref:ABC transporter substrate-binding protein n=1 Tax=Salipaludibacillus sp. HK11 TaxID=3394320 RepID=UPI0039FCE407
MKWKVIILILFSAMLIGMMVACGNDSNNAGADENNDEPEANETENNNENNNEVNDSEEAGDSEPVTIRLHHWYNTEQDNWDVVIDAFEAEHPHIKVESITPENNDANETMQQIDLAAASGDDLDAIIVNDAANYSQRVSQGMFEPLNQYLDDNGIDYEEEYGVDTSVDGDYYALPGKFNGFFVMLNQDALEENGLDVPEEWTWDEYMEYAEILSEGEGSDRRYGTFFHTWTDYLKLAAFNQHEDSNLIKDDGVTSNVDSDRIRQSLEIRQRGHEEDSATPYADTISLDLNYRPQFFGGSAAMIMTGTWMINDSGGVEEGTEFTTAFAPYPQAQEGDPITSPSGADFMAMYSGSEHKDEVFEFLRWYTTEGIVTQSKFLPDFQGVDMEEVVNNLLEESDVNVDLINMESLIHTLEVQEAAALSIPPAFISEVETAYSGEVERFLLDEQDLETTIENAHEAVQNVIDQNVE